MPSRRAAAPNQPTLFTEGVRLSPGQESVLVALDYLDAVPADPQDGRETAEVAHQAGITPHIVRARLVELRQAGFVASGDCPQHNGVPLADAETRYAHFLTPAGYLRSRWAVAGRRAATNGNGAIDGQESRLLVRLYLTAAVPTDRLAQARRALAWIGESYRAKTDQQVSDAELVRHMIRCRKQGHWPRLGRSVRSVFEESSTTAAVVLPDNERDALYEVYRDLGRSCDALMTSAWHGRSLARAFEDATGTRRPVRLLLDTLIATRKAGHLPRLRADHDDGPA